MKKDHFRKNFPSDFKAQTEVQDKVIAFIAGLPSGNFLELFLAENEIDMTVNTTKKIAALGFNETKINEAIAGHISVGKRNHDYTPIIHHMEDGFQFLKNFSPSNMAGLLLWGANISVDGKITMPTNPAELLAMFKIYSDKSASYSPSPSPIDPLYAEREWDMAADVHKYLSAKAHNDDADASFIASEQGTDNRDTKWELPLADLVLIYNISRIFYKDDFRMLAKMGFDVVSTPTTHHDQTSTALQLQHVLIHGAIIGSVIHNLNDFDVLIHPGHDIGDSPIKLLANEIMAVKKGMSQFVFENPDALRIAKILSTVRKHG